MKPTYTKDQLNFISLRKYNKSYKDLTFIEFNLLFI